MLKPGKCRQKWLLRLLSSPALYNENLTFSTKSPAVLSRCAAKILASVSKLRINLCGSNSAAECQLPKLNHAGSLQSPAPRHRYDVVKRENKFQSYLDVQSLKAASPFCMTSIRPLSVIFLPSLSTTIKAGIPRTL